MSLSRRYQHLIWDWNGTLLDDLELCIAAMNGMLAPRGLPALDRSRYLALFDFPVRTYYGRLGFEEALHPFETLSVEFITAYDAKRWDCALQPGVREILTAVTAAGLTQSVLSAYRQDTLREIIRHFGLEPHFVRITGLNDIYAHSKLEAGRAWVEELALPRDSLLLVGDTLHDLDVAEALGIDCVLVAHGHHPLERLRARTPRVVSDLAALAAELGLSLQPAPTTGPIRAPARLRDRTAGCADRGNPAR